MAAAGGAAFPRVAIELHELAVVSYLLPGSDAPRGRPLAVAIGSMAPDSVEHKDLGSLVASSGCFEAVKDEVDAINGHWGHPILGADIRPALLLLPAGAEGQQQQVLPLVASEMQRLGLAVSQQRGLIKNLIMGKDGWLLPADTDRSMLQEIVDRVNASVGAEVMGDGWQQRAAAAGTTAAYTVAGSATPESLGSEFEVGILTTEQPTTAAAVRVEAGEGGAGAGAEVGAGVGSKRKRAPFSLPPRFLCPGPGKVRVTAPTHTEATMQTKQEGEEKSDEECSVATGDTTITDPVVIVKLESGTTGDGTGGGGGGGGGGDGDDMSSVSNGSLPGDGMDDDDDMPFDNDGGGGGGDDDDDDDDGDDSWFGRWRAVQDREDEDEEQESEDEQEDTQEQEQEQEPDDEATVAPHELGLTEHIAEEPAPVELTDAMVSGGPSHSGRVRHAVTGKSQRLVQALRQPPYHAAATRLRLETAVDDAACLARALAGPGLAQLTSLYIGCPHGWDSPVLHRAIGALPRLRELAFPFAAVTKSLALCLGGATDSSPVKTLHLLHDYAPLSAFALPFTAPGVRALTLAGFRGLTYRHLRTALQAFPGLRHLSFRLCLPAGRRWAPDPRARLEAEPAFAARPRGWAARLVLDWDEDDEGGDPEVVSSTTALYRIAGGVEGGPGGGGEGPVVVLERSCWDLGRLYQEIVGGAFDRNQGFRVEGGRLIRRV